MPDHPGPVTDGGIGILGGTFDPIHIAHLEVAMVVRFHLSLESIYFVPAYRNPLKNDDQILSSADQRLEMVTLATSDNDWMHVDPVEINRGYETERPSYTIETLEYFRNQFPEAPLALIVGADNTNLDQWYRIEEFSNYLSRIVVISRPSYSTNEQVYTEQIQSLRMGLPGIFELIEFLPILDQPVSATEIRATLARGIMPENILHPKVEAFIRQNGLYGFKGAD